MVIGSARPSGAQEQGKTMIVNAGHDLICHVQ